MGAALRFLLGVALATAPAARGQLDYKEVNRLSELLSAGAYEELIGAAQQLASNPTVSPETREFALWTKVSAHQSTGDHRAVVLQVDRSLETFPGGAYRQAFDNARTAAQKVLGVEARLKLTGLLDGSRFAAAIAAADSILDQSYHGQSTFATALHIKMQALTWTERYDELGDLAAEFARRFPDSELLPEVRRLDARGARQQHREEHPPAAPSLLLDYRDLLDLELLTPQSVTAPGGPDGAQPPVGSLIDYRDPALGYPWVSPPAARAELLLELRPDSPRPAFVGIQFPRSEPGKPRRAVLEVAPAAGGPARSFACDLGEARIQVYGLPPEWDSSRLRLSLIDEDDTVFPFRVARLYALGPNRARERAEIDAENLRRTVFPHFEIGARHLPLDGPRSAAKRGLVDLGRDLVKVRRIGGDRVVGVTPEGEILVLDARTGRIRRRIQAPGRDLTRTFYNDRSGVLYALVLDGGDQRVLVPVDLTSGQIGAPVNLGGREPCSLAFARGSGQALVAFAERLELRTSDLGLVLWATDFGRIARSARGIVPAFGRRGGLVAAGLPDGRLLVFDRETGRVRYEYPRFRHALWDVMFLHDDQVLVAASEAEVTAYSLLSGKLLFNARTPLRRAGCRCGTRGRPHRGQPLSPAPLR